MKDYIEDLKNALDSFKSVKSDIDEIRRCKNEVQALKEQMYETALHGRYIHDDHRIILSAPEIIIGNVDHAGNLLGDGGSTVILRGNSVHLQGTGGSGIGGSVITKASHISQIAVDPGRDGLENVVWKDSSSIVNHAVSISLCSENSSGSMVDVPDRGISGVSISSETGISIDALPSNKNKKDSIDSIVKDLDDAGREFTSQINELKSSFDKILKELSDAVSYSSSRNDSEVNVRTNYQDLQGMRSKFVGLESSLCIVLDDYVRMLSLKAETERSKDQLKKMKDELGKATSDFPKKTTCSSVCLRSESFCFSSVDGDGNIRANDEAGFYVSAPHVNVSAHDMKGALIKDSSICLNVEKFNLSTQNAKYEGDKMDKGTFTSEGNVTVTSRNVTVQTVDTELKDKKITEKALTKDGTVKIRAQVISVDSTDTEGKSAGDINLNGKNIRIASMDVDKDKRTDKSMAAGSQMVLLSEKMFTGSSDKKNKSKLVQVVSDKVSIIGDTTAEMQQGESKAVVTLDGGNLSAGGGKVELSGDTTIKGKADIKGDVEAPNGKFKGVEAGGKFKSPSISDGMMGGTAGVAGKPSAKMKMEEAQKKEGK